MSGPEPDEAADTARETARDDAPNTRPDGFLANAPDKAPDKANIAILNYALDGTGTVTKSIEIASATRAAGIAAQLWAVDGGGKLADRARTAAPVLTLRTNRGTKNRPAGNRTRGLIGALWPLARALRAHKPTLLLSAANHFHLVAWLALCLSGQRRRTRFIARASNSSQRGGRGPGHIFVRLHNRLKYSGADEVIAVCRELADEIALALPRKAIRAIPNGVDIARVERLSTQPADHPFFHQREDEGGGPVLISMGRLARQKGFDLLIRALAALPDEGKPRLILLGDGPPAAYEELRALAAELDVTERVDLAGYHPNPFALISRADLFVCASRWEGASNTVLEAMLCGVPVVATDCPTGNREIITGSPHGRLARTGDAEDIARAIMAALSGAKTGKGAPPSAAHHAAGEWAASERTAHEWTMEQWAIEKCLSQWVATLRHPTC